MFGFKKKNYLKRIDFITSADSNKIWSKSMTISEIKLLLEHLENELSKHEFDIDENFIMNARRKRLQEMIEERLQKNDENTNELIVESLFNFWEFVGDEYPGGAGGIMSVCRELGISVQKFDKMDKAYREKGIICVQEKDVILEIILAIKNYISDMSKQIVNNETIMRKNKIRGSLIGGAIGDALGYQIEFKRNIKDKEITNFKDGLGIISDDTQMTLFTANALLFRETRGAMRGIALLPVDAIYEAYLDWLDTQNHTSNHKSISWIKNIKELNIPRAPGNTCISALASGTKGTIEKPINDSKGCGGVMRVAPVGLYMRDSETAGKLGAKASALTHGHPLGIIPAYVFSTLIWYLSNTETTIEDALKMSIIQFKEKFNIFNKKDTNNFLELIDKAIKMSKDNILDIEAINELGEGWVAEEAFAIAIYSCLKYSNSFKKSVVCAVNHDGDSDSTGAIAGNIIGAYLGYDSIPDEFKNNIELKDIILELADDLSIDVPVGEYKENNDKQWLDKYLYCKKDN